MFIYECFILLQMIHVICLYMNASSSYKWYMLHVHIWRLHPPTNDTRYIFIYEGIIILQMIHATCSYMNASSSYKWYMLHVHIWMLHPPTNDTCYNFIMFIYECFILLQIHDESNWKSMSEINLGHIQFLFKTTTNLAPSSCSLTCWHLEKALNIHTTNFQTTIAENLSIQTDVVFTHNS